MFKLAHRYSADGAIATCNYLHSTSQAKNLATKDNASNSIVAPGEQNAFFDGFFWKKNQYQS